jgi:nitric-oxide synthase
MFGLSTLFQKRRVKASSSGVQIAPTSPVLAHPQQEKLLQEARDYLQLFHTECGFPEEQPGRLAEVQAEIAQSGAYWQTIAELAYGARVAWRNNARCIGRLHWQTLTVRDMRHLSTAEDIFQALLEHLRFATNGGKIRSTITVFAPAFPGQESIRIWNPQLIRYAGYRHSNGTIVGDPLQAEFTDVLRALGWRGGLGTPFDILPIVIQLPGQPPQLFDLPDDLVLEVPLSHPDYAWFADLGLKWHALPVISNMRMEIGGISYPAAPFNGWYMGTEIGARNLGDVNRYNLLPVIAEKMGVDTHSDRSLWRDRALVELNVAVLSSFAEAGVTVVDHHTASRQFLLHDARETRHGRDVPAHWVWLVPPLSGSASPLFPITTYKNIKQKPNFFYQPAPWQHLGLAESLNLQNSHMCPSQEQLTPMLREAHLS